MKASELKIGEFYRIKWCKTVPTKNSFVDPPPLTMGVGRLKQVGFPRAGWHKFTLKGTSQVVYANSRNVELIADDKSVFMAEPKVIAKEEVSHEVAKLRLIGADDDKRREEVETIATFLSGLGVESKADKEYTHLIIPYLGLANFKAVVARLYNRALLSEEV